MSVLVYWCVDISGYLLVRKMKLERVVKTLLEVVVLVVVN